MCTRHGPLRGPTTFRIELANAFEQPVRGHIQMHRQFRNLLTQFLDGEHAQDYTLVQWWLQRELSASQCCSQAQAAS